MVTAKGDLYIALAAGLDRGVYRMDRKGRYRAPAGQRSDLLRERPRLRRSGHPVCHRIRIDGLDRPPPGPGGIWRIPRGGQAELCLRDGLLRGTGVLGQPVPIGANGIAYYHGNLYVTNTEKGTVVRLPVWPDGSAGVPELWTTLQEVLESPLAGAPSPGGGGRPRPRRARQPLCGRVDPVCGRSHQPLG